VRAIRFWSRCLPLKAIASSSPEKQFYVSSVRSWACLSLDRSAAMEAASRLPPLGMRTIRLTPIRPRTATTSTRMAMSRLRSLTLTVPMEPYLLRQVEGGTELLPVVALEASGGQGAAVEDAVAVGVDLARALAHPRVAITSSFFT
jgi:hypothetical protein